MKTLITEYQTSAAHAAAMLEPKREALHQAATQRRDELAEQLSDDVRRDDLVCIIEDALDQADEATRVAAPLKVQQLTAGIMHPRVKSGDGSILLDVFIDAAKGYTDTQRHDALQACLLMASNHIDPGLFQFADPYHDRLTLAILDAFAAIIDPTSYNKHTAHRAALQTEQAEAARLANFTSSPVAISPSLTPEATKEPETIAIRYREQGTPLVAAGVKLNGYGMVNHVTREEFERLQGSPLYIAGVQCGSIEVQP